MEYVAPSYNRDSGMDLSIDTFDPSPLFKCAGVQREGVQREGGVEDSDLDKVLRLNGTVAPDHKAAAAYRHCTKFTVCIARVPRIKDDGTLEPVYMIRAVAPNLYGTSKEDSRRYLKKDGSVNIQNYTADFKEIARLVLFAVAATGLTTISIAEFGGGVYSSGVKTLEEKERLNQVRYQAFASAAEVFNVRINWVIYERDRHAESKVTMCERSLFGQHTVMQGDIVTGIDNLPADPLKNLPVVMDNGSDRTMGGNKHLVAPTPVEEQLMQSFLALPVMSNLNPFLHSKIALLPNLMNDERAKAEYLEVAPEGVFCRPIICRMSLHDMFYKEFLTEYEGKNGELLSMLVSFFAPETVDYRCMANLQEIIQHARTTENGTALQILRDMKILDEENKVPQIALDLFSLTPEEALSKVSLMSGCPPRVDPAASVVSQNFKGPYAIVKTRNGYWECQFPNHRRIDESNQQAIIEVLKRISGMRAEDCQSLVEAMVRDNANNKGSVSQDRTEGCLNNLANKYSGIGSSVGSRRHKAVESNEHYQDRVKMQIDCLTKCIGGSEDQRPKFLCFQGERGVLLGADGRGQTVFQESMEAFGYSEVAASNHQDNGIWVRSDLLSRIFSLSSGDLKTTLIENQVLSGCATVHGNTLCISLHSQTKAYSMDVFVRVLSGLKHLANQYADQHGLKKISIQGQLGLYRLTPDQQDELRRVGFSVWPAKGQEDFEQQTCEACVFADVSARPTITSEKQTSPVPFNFG